MMTTDPDAAQDLGTLDRDVAEAVDAWSRWRRDLFADPESRAGEDPLGGALRHVASKGTYDALVRRASDPASADAPWTYSLSRFVAHLLQARVTREVDVALARAMGSPDAVLTLPDARKVSFRDAIRQLVANVPRGEAVAWLDAAAARGPDVARIARERAERRAEVVHRLGRDPSEGELRSSRSVARELLDRTDDLFSSVLKEWRKGEDLSLVAPSPVDAIRCSMARDAPDGWPAHLSARWVSELFAERAGDLRKLPIELPPMPRALGGASFAGVLEAFGSAVRTARLKSSMPFALRNDPLFVDAHRVGAVFGALVTSRTFFRCSLGTSARVAASQSRTLTRTALFTARLRAARVLLGGEMGPVAIERVEELSERVFGAALPRALSGAFPLARDDEPARFLGMVTALPLTRALVDRFDEDWFRKPRAFDAFRSRAAYSAHEPPSDADALAVVAGDLARAFEEALG